MPVFEENEAPAAMARGAAADPVAQSQGLLRGLNPEQLAAVTLPARPALILAGAGSGKTRVLTTRIAWLIQTGQLSPGGVMAVTFTNKAAKEMLTRLGAMLPLPVRGMWIARSTACATASCGRTGSWRRCPRVFRFSIRATSSRPSNASSRR